MKNLILLLLGCLCLSGYTFSQEVYSIDTVLWVEDSASKEDLYSRAKVWLTESFIDANSVIELDDETNGIIIGNVKGLEYTWPKFTGSECYSGEMSYVIKLYFKDGRFKFEATNFRHTSKNLDNEGCNLGLLYDEGFLSSFLYSKDGKGYVNWRDQAKEIGFERAEFAGNLLIESLFKTMNQKLETKDDW